MSSKLYVGNLSYQMTESDLKDLFAEFGGIRSVKIIMDRELGRSKGFGFVEMETSEEANEAIETLDGQENNGRRLKVTIAQDKPKTRDFRGGRQGEREFSRRW